jgi:subtilase family serine protease
MLVDADGKIEHFALGQGYGPSDIQSAYNLPTTGGNGKIVAVIDANDYPQAESDLAAYRSQYGLPACTSASGCFIKVGQTGSATALPSPDPQGCNGWNQEAALDLQMASAACPDCKIMIVEANSATTPDLAAAVQTAVSLGASAISNSYGGGEQGGEQSTESVYTQYAKGILVTASAGDNGYGAEYPATSAGVVAVGGTSLSQGGGARGWSEAAWSSNGATGSGCSAVIPKPSWQTDTGCSMRMEADISAVADPQTGVAVLCGGQWGVAGGTSAASPIVAAAFTLLGVSPNPQFIWTHTSDFYDVTSGSNGSCSVSYQCNAGAGYDGPTGWGTPNGTALLGSGSSSGGGSGSSSSSSGSGSSSSSSGGGPTGSSGSSSGSGGGSGSSGGSGGSGSSGGSSSSGSGGSGSSGGSSGSGGDNSSGSSAAPIGADAGGPPTSSSGGNGASANPGAVQGNLDNPAAGGCAVVGPSGDVTGGSVVLGLALTLLARRRRASRREH